VNSYGGFNGAGGNFLVSSGTGNVLTNGTATAKHFVGGGTSPTVADDGNHDSSISGKDAYCAVTVGTGTITSITVTLGTVYPIAPVFHVQSNVNVDFRVSRTTSSLTITRAGGAFASGEVLLISSGGF